MNGGTHWWEIVQAFGPIAILIAAILAYFGVARTIRANRTSTNETLAQVREDGSDERRARNQQEWWKRVSWCLEMCASDDNLKQQLGFSAVPVLVRSELAGEEERQMIDAAVTRLFADLQIRAEG